jgi:phosphoadenosine phosphosulfate reductase
MSETLADRLDRELPKLEVSDRLALLRAAVTGDIVLTTSFGLEDQVLTHLVAEAGLEIRLVTLDTGRMFPETYELWQRTEQTYAIRIEPVVAEAADVQPMVRTYGINGFYDSVEARKACCHARKIAPLGRALAGAQLWITGLRADQSQQRGQARWAVVDSGFGVVKASPLLDWSRDRTLAFAEAHDVPLNPLHAKGFVSIGCAPCTRAIAAGEDERAGRWWWEQESHKECGLHWGADGTLIRPAAVETGA